MSTPPLDKVTAEMVHRYVVLKQSMERIGRDLFFSTTAVARRLREAGVQTCGRGGRRTPVPDSRPGRAAPPPPAEDVAAAVNHHRRGAGVQAVADLMGWPYSKAYKVLGEAGEQMHPQGRPRGARTDGTST